MFIYRLFPVMESELLIDITQTTFVADKGDCEDLAGHCSHSAAHVSGMLSALSLPFLDKPIAYSLL